MALVEPQKAFAELDIEVRRALGVAGPAHVVTFQGVPMLRVYVRPERARGAAEPAPVPVPDLSGPTAGEPGL